MLDIDVSSRIVTMKKKTGTKKTKNQ